MKKYILLISTVIGANLVQAQNFGEALRYSNYQYGSTTRSLGLGGTMGAVGADFSTASTNPAGLAWYRKSEMGLTFGVKNTNAQTQLLGGNNLPFEQNDIAGTFNHFGFVFTLPIHDHRNWKSLTFGIGVNRLADLNRGIYITGTSKGSLLDRWENLANNGSWSDLERFPAIESGAIYYDSTTRSYISDLMPNAATMKKTQSIDNSGYVNEMVVSYAGNYQERLLLGMTIGIPFLRSTETKTYTEVDENGTLPVFDKLVFKEFLRTEGVGMNAKLGVIFRMHQNFRLGIAVHTPSLFFLRDTFLNEAAYTFTERNQTKSFTGVSPSGITEYSLRTPWRFLANANILAGKYGMLMGEAEWVNYNGAKYNYSNDQAEAQQAVNQSISDSLRQSLSVRFGGELTLSMFRLRAGAGFQMSPLANDKTLNWMYSAGIGIRNRGFFADLGYRNTAEAYRYQPYQHFTNPQKVETNLNYHQIMMTLGFRF